MFRALLGSPSSPSTAKPCPAPAGEPLSQESRLAAAARKVSLQLNRDRLKVGNKSRISKQFSVFERVSSADKDELMKLAMQDSTAKRAIGAMVGMAVGDAIGSPLEFVAVSCKGSSFFNPRSFTYKGEFNKFKMKPGQFTDDTSMGLCMADSLLVCGGYDGADIRVRFWNWWYKGYNNAFRFDSSRGSSVGLGGNISLSLKAIQGDRPTPRFESGSVDAGNGSIMRLAPCALYFHRDERLAREVCAESSYTTHPGDIAADCCSFLGLVIRRALLASVRRSNSAQFLDDCVASFLAEPQGAGQELQRMLRSSEPVGSKERCWNWRDPKGPFIMETISARGAHYNGYPVTEDYFGAFSMDGLAIALHCFYHTRSFMDAIVRCVNCLGDADSVAAVCGQMAGAYYGVDAIDSRAISNLRTWDAGEVALRGALLYALGAQLTEEALQQRANSSGSPPAGSPPAEPASTPETKSETNGLASVTPPRGEPTSAPTSPKSPKTPTSVDVRTDFEKTIVKRSATPKNTANALQLAPVAPVPPLPELPLDTVATLPQQPPPSTPFRGMRAREFSEADEEIGEEVEEDDEELTDYVECEVADESLGGMNQSSDFLRGLSTGSVVVTL
eukprot:TRINITY_DN33491_c0_g1_i1.p1 TRINITY_DN33491_c0_g1~~TRINITY_DN33491_c0_g1_i1.p1  ORF type:complete len:617 (+),score=130.99 TRINITY_DN33491_c0_g1_i1:155-2005(+)